MSYMTTQCRGCRGGGRDGFNLTCGMCKGSGVDPWGPHPAPAASPGRVLGMEVRVDPSMPPDEVSFRDKQGNEVGRIVGIASPGTAEALVDALCDLRRRSDATSDDWAAARAALLAHVEALRGGRDAAVLAREEYRRLMFECDERAERRQKQIDAHKDHVQALYAAAGLDDPADEAEAVAGVASLRARVDGLREVIGETFTALVKAGPEIGDLATKGLPYAVDALRARVEEAERENDRHVRDWYKILLAIAEVVDTEGDPEALVAEDFDPWEALRTIKRRLGVAVPVGGGAGNEGKER